jgi:hypothetical protein
MAKKNIQIKLSTFIQVTLGLVFIVAAVMIVFLVNRNMRQQALVEAETKARIILDLNLATHTYFSQQLKPKLFKLTEYQRSYDYFEPTWMSSTLRYERFINISNPLGNLITITKNVPSTHVLLRMRQMLMKGFFLKNWARIQN